MKLIGDGKAASGGALVRAEIVDSRAIAERLGLPEDVVRAVQRRGVLWRLDLDDAEIRERLWRGHLRSGLPHGRHAPRDGGSPSTRRSSQ